ncbi:MFS transporter [Brachybacterium sp. GPGPB12]|uniref:MFS transporter n=1 Tax=Brachybacterium sp. GPGPB12 TaxID=3023517 RepID=UPI003134523B
MIGEIRASLGLSATVVSLLTTIPVFVFGAFAFLTPGLTRRLGMHRLLGLVPLVLATGNLLRHEPSMTALFAGTVLVGSAIAVGNVVMPAAIKQDFAHRAGLMMGLYTMSLFVGAAFASGLTAPLSPVLGGGWRGCAGDLGAPGRAGPSRVVAAVAPLARTPALRQCGRRRPGRPRPLAAGSDPHRPHRHRRHRVHGAAERQLLHDGDLGADHPAGRRDGRDRRRRHDRLLRLPRRARRPARADPRRTDAADVVAARRGRLCSSAPPISG